MLALWCNTASVTRTHRECRSPAPPHKPSANQSQRSSAHDRTLHGTGSRRISARTMNALSSSSCPRRADQRTGGADKAPSHVPTRPTRHQRSTAHAVTSHGNPSAGSASRRGLLTQATCVQSFFASNLSEERELQVASLTQSSLSLPSLPRPLHLIACLPLQCQALSSLFPRQSILQLPCVCRKKLKAD